MDLLQLRRLRGLHRERVVLGHHLRGCHGLVLSLEVFPAWEHPTVRLLLSRHGLSDGAGAGATRPLLFGGAMKKAIGVVGRTSRLPLFA